MQPVVRKSACRDLAWSTRRLVPGRTRAAGGPAAEGVGAPHRAGPRARSSPARARGPERSRAAGGQGQGAADSGAPLELESLLSGGSAACWSGHRAAWPPGLGSCLHFLARKAWRSQACRHCVPVQQLPPAGHLGTGRSSEGRRAPWLRHHGRKDREASVPDSRGVCLRRSSRQTGRRTSSNGVFGPTYVQVTTASWAPATRPPHWLDPSAPPRGGQRAPWRVNPEPMRPGGTLLRGAGFPSRVPASRVFRPGNGGFLTSRLLRYLSVQSCFGGSLAACAVLCTCDTQA